MQAIPALVCNPRVFARHLQTGFLPILGPLLFARQMVLRVRQTTLTAAHMPGVGNPLARAQHDHVFQPDIHTDRRTHDRQCLKLLLHQERDEGAPGGILRNGDGGGRPGEGPRPVDVQRRVHLRQCEGACLCVPFERAARVGRGLASVLLVEGGILGTPLEEGAEGFVQVTQCLLQRHAGHIVQPSGF